MTPAAAATGWLRVGAITPHGDLAIAEACDTASRHLARATQQAMDEVGRRIAASGADAVVICTPHGVHVRGHMAVVTATAAAGVIDSPVPVPVRCSIDRPLALAAAAAMRAAGIPAVEVSYGGNNPAEAVAPLDWGAAIPLFHILRHAPGLPAVVVSPARELGAAQHVTAGHAIAAAAAGMSRRIAFVASADQGHGHGTDGPYGHHPESAAFDERVNAVIRGGRLGDLVAIDVADVHAAVADSWWQMLMLHGALTADGRPYDCELLAYEAPTYYGMVTALATPRR